MSERMVGEGKDFKIYPPGETPEPYIPPWERKGRPRRREVRDEAED